MVDLPTSFDPPAYDESHLIFNEIEGDGLVTVSWPLIGIELLVTKREYPPHDEAMRHTPGLYFHGHSGYSIQEFHEFFLQGLPEYCSFRLGTVAVSMGEITPLGIFLFDRYYDDDVHGEWQDLASVRLIGVTSEYAEAYFLNAQVIAVYFQVEIHPVIAGSAHHVTNTVLIAVFAAGTFMHLGKRLGLIGAEKRTNYLGCFRFSICLLFILNGNFNIIGKIF